MLLKLRRIQNGLFIFHVGMVRSACGKIFMLKQISSIVFLVVVMRVRVSQTVETQFKLFISSEFVLLSNSIIWCWLLAYYTAIFLLTEEFANQSFYRTEEFVCAY